MEARFRQTVHRCHDLLDFMGNGYCRVSTKMWGNIRLVHIGEPRLRESKQITKFFSAQQM